MTDVGYDVGGLADSSLTGRAEQYTFDADAAYAIDTRMYADGDDSSRRDLESEIESHPDALDATRVDLRIDEPLVTIAVELDHDRFLEHFGPPIDYPLVIWNLTYDEDAEEVEVVHHAGEDVDPDRLELQSRGIDDELSQFGDEYRTVSQGDSPVVDVAGSEDWAVILALVDPVTGDTEPSVVHRVVRTHFRPVFAVRESHVLKHEVCGSMAVPNYARPYETPGLRRPGGNESQ